MSLKVDKTDGLDFNDESVTVCLMPLRNFQEKLENSRTNLKYDCHKEFSHTSRSNF